MRTYALAIAAAALVVAPISALSQSVEVGPGGVRVNPGAAQSGQCEELRLACQNKEQLGEQGEGNCRQISRDLRR